MSSPATASSVGDTLASLKVQGCAVGSKGDGSVRHGLRRIAVSREIDKATLPKHVAAKERRTRAN